MTPTDKELIDAYFDDPDTRFRMMSELGDYVKIEVDLKKNLVSARGELSGKQWNLRDLLADLRNMAVRDE